MLKKGHPSNTCQQACWNPILISGYNFAIGPFVIDSMEETSMFSDTSLASEVPSSSSDSSDSSDMENDEQIPVMLYPPRKL